MTDFLLYIKTVILRFSPKKKKFKDFNSIFPIWLKIQKVNKLSVPSRTTLTFKSLPSLSSRQNSAHTEMR